MENAAIEPINVVQPRPIVVTNTPMAMARCVAAALPPLFLPLTSLQLTTSQSCLLLWPLCCPKQWPYCDGAHVKHNKDTGDNVGPLVIDTAAPKE